MPLEDVDEASNPLNVTVSSSSTTNSVMLNILTNTNKNVSLAPGDDQDSGVETVDRVLLHQLSSRKSTPLSLSNMYRYASTSPDQRLRNAQFLHGELTIRVAQRAHELLHFPHGLSGNAAMEKVARTYLNFLSKLLSSRPPSNATEERKFTQMIRRFVLDRAVIPVDIASGLDQYLTSSRSENQRIDSTQLLDIEYALYRFFTGRVGLRFLMEHHILSDPSLQDVDLYRKQSYYTYIPHQEDVGSYIGCIQKDCNTILEVQRVAAQVMQQSFEKFGITPNIEVLDASVKSKFRNRAFTYVPHHLHYMVAELLKNSCRAVVRQHAGRPGLLKNKLPPVRVVVSKGAEDVTIKIADTGGGIPRSTFKRIWSFVHSNNDIKVKLPSHSPSDGLATNAAHKQEREFGLPLARVYARYFGGELILKSMEGYGVDAYLYLPVLGDTCEKVPDRETNLPNVFDFHEPDYDD
jgi:pyruvate dehydrogenase kinase 2/3/4